MEPTQENSQERRGFTDRMQFWRYDLEQKIVSPLRTATQEQAEDIIVQESLVLAAQTWRLQDQQNRDVLTRGLKYEILSARGWEARLNLGLIEVAHGTPMGVAMIDLDKFGTVVRPKPEEEHLLTDEQVVKLRGERYRRGDMAIVTYAEILGETLADMPGSQIARIGGEEMMILVYAQTREDFEAKLEQIRSQIEENLSRRAGIENLIDRERQGRQTASIGGVWLPEGTVTAKQTVEQQVETQVYAAKAAGRNRVMSSGAEEVKTTDLISAYHEETDRLGVAREVWIAAEATKLQTELEAARQHKELDIWVWNTAQRLSALEKSAQYDFTGTMCRSDEAVQQIEELLLLERQMGHTVRAMMIDIRGFKQINDLQPEGHVAGNRVLIATVEAIKEELELSGLNPYIGVRWKPGGGFLFVASGHPAVEVTPKDLQRGISERISEEVAGKANLDQEVQPVVEANVVAVEIKGQEDGRKISLEEVGEELEVEMRKLKRELGL